MGCREIGSTKNFARRHASFAVFRKPLPESVLRCSLASKKFVRLGWDWNSTGMGLGLLEVFSTAASKSLRHRGMTMPHRTRGCYHGQFSSLDSQRKSP